MTALAEVNTVEEIEALPVNTVLMCRVHEVFHLHEAGPPLGGPQWVAAGYDNTWTSQQVAEWAPLTVIYTPPALAEYI